MDANDDCIAEFEEKLGDVNNFELQSGDRLFGRGDNPVWDMDLEYALGNLNAHILAYKEVADRLAIRILCRRPAIGAFEETYPILALYRHYIELELKGIIIYAHRPLEKETSTSFRKNFTGKKGHDVGWLWTHAKQLIDQANVDEDLQIDWALLQTYIDDVVSLSYDFGRYPFRADYGSVTLPAQVINMENLLMFMNRLGETLKFIRNYLLSL